MVLFHAWRFMIGTYTEAFLVFLQLAFIVPCVVARGMPALGGGSTSSPIFIACGVLLLLLVVHDLST